MTNAFDYKEGPEAEETRFDSSDLSLNSGVHDLHDLYDFDEESASGVKRQNQDRRAFLPEIHEESAPQSWIGGLIAKLKERIGSDPPKVVVKEHIPSAETDLMEKIEMEEQGLELFRNILANRKRLHQDALTLGMSLDDIRDCGDYCLDPVITQTWEKHFKEREKIVSDLKMQLETKRAERLARKSVAPSSGR